MYPLFILIFALICIRIYSFFTIKDCKSKNSMIGKSVIVTGANSGIGFETAKELARRGARVILACRNEDRATAARDQIIKDTGNMDVVYRHLNLASLASVKHFADNIIKTEKHLDVLINNAGVHGLSDTFTADGIVECMQINYFGPFLLTLLLLPLLKKSRPSRIINLSSILHLLGNIDLENINVKGYYDSVWSYNNNKLCTVSFTVELSKRLAGTGVVVNAVHPGVIFTNISQHGSFIVQAIFAFACLVIGRSLNQGVQTVIHLAVADECATVSGKYFVDCSERFMSWRARNPITGKQLWNYSTKIVDFKGEV